MVPKRKCSNSTDSVVLEWCRNCHRSGVHLKRAVPRKGSFWFVKKKDIHKGDLKCLLCDVCVTCCIDKTLKPWTGFIWSLLINERTRSVIWKFMPLLWKEEWKQQLFHNSYNIDEDDIDVVQDCTTLYSQYMQNMSVDGMKEIDYKTFVMYFEKCMTIPTVRCPWGCSEFLPKTQLIPFDVVVRHFIKEKISMYTETQAAIHKYGFRYDWLENPCDILYNNKWKCRPSIRFEDGVPFVMCCRYHSIHHTLRYIHVPRNPTGFTAFREDNKLAQLVAVPNTVKKFRKNKYTNSYGLYKVTGNFKGIDCINVSSQLKNEVVQRNQVTLHRDQLVLMGRYDCLNNDDTFGFQAALKDLSEVTVDRNVIKSFGSGGTYVPTDEIIRLQTEIKETPMYTIIVAKDDPRMSQNIFYVPSWGRADVEIRTFGDRLGNEFPCSAVFSWDIEKIHRAAVFFLHNTILMIPELWNIVANNVRRNDTWHGWVLHYLTKHILNKNFYAKITLGHPFYTKRSVVKEMIDKLIPFDPSSVSALLCNTIGSLSEVKTFYDGIIPDFDQYTNYSILVNIHQIQNKVQEFVPSVDIKGFSLRMICGTYNDDENIIYVKRRYCPDFWKYSRHGNKVHYFGLNEEESKNVIKTCLRGWKFCIYVRNEQPDYATIKNHLLLSLGGQDKIRCAVHDVSVITVPWRKKSNEECAPLCCCGNCCNAQWMQCAVENCERGICMKCFKSIVASSSDTKFYIGETIHHYTGEDDDGDSDDDYEDNTTVDSNYSSLYSYDEQALKIKDTHHTSGEHLFEEEGSDSTSEAESSMSSIFSEILIDCPNTNNSDDDSTSFCSDEECVIKSDPDLFAGTNSKNKRFVFDDRFMMEEGRIIPNSIILNCQGSLLVRRNQEIKPGTAAKHFLQKLVCASKDKNIPLIHPEGSMFPSLFWIANEDGSLVGDLPSSLLMDDYTLKNYNVASLYDHARTRILDPTLLSSSAQTYWGFLWDVVANLGLRGENTSLVLKRGFQDFIKKEGLKGSTENPKVYDSHQLDSRKTVNQLSAACAVQKTDLFFTWTLNALFTPGVRQITRWVRSEEALLAMKRDINDKFHVLDHTTKDEIFFFEESEDLQEQLEESACMFVVRAWMEFVNLFLNYLEHGKQSPFAQSPLKISHIWNRSEIQNDKDGKAPHQHTLIWLENIDRTEAEMNKILNLIRACIDSFVTDEEYKNLSTTGMFYGNESYFGTLVGFLEKVEELLKHHCTKRCLIPVRKKGPNGEVIAFNERQCKAPDYRLLSPNCNQGCFVPVKVDHDQETLQVLLNLGMIEDERLLLDESNCELDFTPTERYKNILTGEKYIPSCRNTEWKMTAGNPVLFSMLCSTMNLQFVTGFVIFRYLTKYCAQVDKSNRIALRMQRWAGPENVNVFPKEGYNSKITSNKIAANTETKTKKNMYEIDGRSLSMAELLMQFLQYPAIVTTLRFMYIPTQSMALRTVPLKRMSTIKIMEGYKEATSITDLNVQEINSSYRVRKELNFGIGRQLDTFQLVTYADSLFDSTMIDTVGQFNLRPPELRFVNRLPKYSAWFTRERLNGWKDNDPDSQYMLLKKFIKPKYNDTLWIDCCGYRIKIRPLAICKVCKILEENYPKGSPFIRIDFGNERIFRQTKRLFEKLNGNSCHCHSEEEILQLRSMFVNERDDNRSLPVYWYRTVRATDSIQFLYHILLSMGKFKTELELLAEGSMKGAFVKARLLDDSSLEALQKSVDDLAKKYIESQLAYFPLGTQSLDREIVETHRVLNDLFIHDRITSKSLPSALFTLHREACEKEVEQEFRQSRRDLSESFITHLTKELGEFIPSCDDVTNATRDNPITTFDISKTPITKSQNETSFKEHRDGYKEIKKRIDHYKGGHNEMTKSILLVGAGGVGKTVDLRLAGLYGLSQGLNVLSTTLTGKRGAETAGEHMHLRFHISISNKTKSVVELAEEAIQRLLSDPSRLVYLKRMDILLIDEFGQIDAKLLAVLNCILQRIRHSSLWMGGVLLICTMDGKQLKPIDGLSPILSPALMCCFSFVALDVPLRTLDPVLQEIQKISRLTPSELRKDLSLQQTFKQLLLQNCLFFETEEQMLHYFKGENVDLIYCYPRHQECLRVEKETLAKVKKSGNPYVSRVANDFERVYTQAEPSIASEYTSKYLDTKGASREVIFFKDAPFEITFNDTQKKQFFHGQLCLLLDLPSKVSVDRFQSVKLLRAPHGVDTLPERPYVKEKLIQQGWVEINIGKERTVPKYKVGKKGLTGWRIQYGLKHRIATTIHAIMGATASKLITRLDSKGGGSIWEAAQAVVLLSRTRYAKDIIFIGDKNENVDSIWEALLAGGKFNEITQGVLDSLLKRSKIPLQNFINLPAIQSLDMSTPIDIPGKGIWVSYMLVSQKEPGSYYIGSTHNLQRRYREHNSYYGGSKGTGREHSLKAPFVVLGWVSGFQNKHEAQSFEGKWKVRGSQLRQSTRGMASSNKVANLAMLLTQDQKHLTFFSAGRTIELHNTIN